MQITRQDKQQTQVDTDSKTEDRERAMVRDEAFTKDEGCKHKGGGEESKADCSRSISSLTRRNQRRDNDKNKDKDITQKRTRRPRSRQNQSMTKTQESEAFTVSLPLRFTNYRRQPY
jgi:hypothetical protein